MGASVTSPKAAATKELARLAGESHTLALCRPGEATSRPLQVRGEPAPLHGGPLVLLRFMRRNGMLNRKYGRLIAALGVAEAALARAPADRRAVLRRPGRAVRDRPRRGRPARPLVLDRPRHEDPRPRGRGLDRRQDRDGPGVHDLRLPARLDRPRVHRRRPRDADRLRPRRGRGGAPDPPAGHLQARRRRRPQLLDRLRRLHPARRDGRRQRDRRHQHRRHQGRAGQRGRRRRARAGAAHARRAETLRWASRARQLRLGGEATESPVRPPGCVRSTE